MKIRVPSYAKINWFLDIHGKRSDGFHEILTLFQTVSLADVLIFNTRREGLRLETGGRELPGGKDNLVYRAADLLREKTGCGKGAGIVLQKKIPMGAGLGGGSSNAAVTLLVLNCLWDCGLNLEELKEIAAELGSDVPCFLIGGPCIGWGRGERIEVPEGMETERDLVLIYPGFGVPTALAYSLLDKPHVEISRELTRDGLRTTIRRSEEIIESGNFSGMNNDFEVPVFGHFPDFQKLISRIRGTGSGKLMLSGSGSVIICAGERSYLQGVAESLRAIGDSVGGIEIFRCRTVSRAGYRSQLEEFFSYAAG